MKLKNIIISFFLIIFILSSINISFALDEDNNKPVGSCGTKGEYPLLEEFISTHDIIECRVSGKFYSTYWILGNLMPESTESDPVELSYLFLEENKLMFNIINSRYELALRDLSEKEFVSLVGFKQIYKNVDVSGAALISIDKSTNKIRTVNISYIPIKEDIDVENIISEKEVKLIALEDVGGSLYDVKNINLKIIGPKQNYNKPRLVWKLLLVPLLSFNESVWDYVIDAHSGEIIVKSRVPIKTTVLEDGGQINLKSNLLFVLIRNVVTVLLLVGIIVFLIFRFKKRRT